MSLDLSFFYAINITTFPLQGGERLLVRCKHRLVTRKKTDISHKVIQIKGVHCHDSSIIVDK